ncbi:MAG: phytoene/squalene synthase family protein [Cytophagales bacterium]
MNNKKELFDTVSIAASKITTTSYSTSFSLGIRLLEKKFRNPIYAIYGFVRFADEIVDTFHNFDKKNLLEDFKLETYKAIFQGISLNPILNSFQHVVKKYDIPFDLIDKFLKSMEMDLSRKDYDFEGFKEYILGSAEVVGLMCLKVFVEGDQKKYDELKDYAMSLGSAFQKINFLRDLKADYQEMGRAYFPKLDMNTFDDSTKAQIELDIENDFKHAYEGILKLEKSSRFGVYIAYVYYFSLFKKIKSLPSKKVMQERIRIPDQKKYMLLLTSYLRHNLNLL